MTTPRRRLVRPRAIIPNQEVQQERQRRKLRERLDKAQLALDRWMTRHRRAFNAVDRLYRTISRLEKQIARLEE